LSCPQEGFLKKAKYFGVELYGKSHREKERETDRQKERGRERRDIFFLLTWYPIEENKLIL
jgi:hypothetical protein